MQPRHRVAYSLLLSSCALLIGPRSALGTIYHLTPASNWFNVINGSGLAPGDEVILSAGTYSHTSRLSIQHRGTAEAPIVIRAAEGAQVTITRPTASQNVMDVEGAQYLSFRGLAITGGSLGMRIRELNGFHPKFLTVEDSHIHHTGAGAITANAVGSIYDNLLFRRNEINNTGGGGAGFYLGCNNGAGGATECVFHDGLIEGNYVHDLVGGVGDGIQIKDGSYNNVIRDNVVHTTGTLGAVGILVYGTDGNAPNLIEGNVVWDAGDNAIQAAADAIVRNNLVFSAALNGIQVRTHQSAVPGNLTIVNNTIISSNDALSISPPPGGLSGPIVVANNALYATGTGKGLRWPGSGDVTISSNVGQGTSFPALGLNAWDPSGNLLNDFGNIAAKDAFPIAGSKLLAAADAAYLPTVDFNSTSRNGTADVGAYASNINGNPGWQVTTGFKEFPPGILGDYNSNGIIDVADLAYWHQHYGQPVAAGSGADGNGNGLIDAADYTIWRDLYESSLVTTTVPEPLAAILALLGPATLIFRRCNFA